MYPFCEGFAQSYMTYGGNKKEKMVLYKCRNMKSMFISYFNKMKRYSQFYNTKLSNKTEDSGRFFIFLIGSSLPHEINTVFLSYWKASNQVCSSLFYILLTAGNCKRFSKAD